MTRHLSLMFGCLLLGCLLIVQSSSAQQFTLLGAGGSLPPVPTEQLHPLEKPADLDALIQAANDKRVVMLGESTHGTHEFYVWRDLISRRLIEEQGFRWVLVEGDFASLHEVNRYIRHEKGAAKSAQALLRKLDRWPQWMWGNNEMVVFVEWLRAYNQGRPAAEQVSFMGLDLYGEWRSYDAVLASLKRVDRRLYRTANKAYRCIKPFKNHSWNYARAVKAGQVDCRESLAEVMALVHSDHPKLNSLAPDDLFYLRQNARVVHKAERHFRLAMTEGELASWNARVMHMQQSLQAVMDLQGESGRVLVWAHNSHIGDARFTSMRESGHLNIGQLAREHWGNEAVFLVGFSTFEGRTIAALGWGGAIAAMRLPAAARDSAEEWLASANHANFYWAFSDEDRANPLLQAPWGQRAVGVVYSPSHDRQQYEPSLLPERYDALVFFRQTRPLTPLVVPRR